MTIEIGIKIVQVFISILMPVIVFFIGFKLTKSIESIKNQSARQHNWNMKWADVFFESHKNYQNLVTMLLSKLDQLWLKVNEKTQNDEDGLALQDEIMKVAHEIQHAGLQLRLHISSFSRRPAAIVESTEKIYKLIFVLFKTKVGNLFEIYEELEHLNKLVKDAHKTAIGHNA